MIRTNVPSGYNKLQLWNINFHLSVRSFTELKQEHNDVFFCYLGEKNLHFSNIQKIQTYWIKQLLNHLTFHTKQIIMDLVIKLKVNTFWFLILNVSKRISTLGKILYWGANVLLQLGFWQIVSVYLIFKWHSKDKQPYSTPLQLHPKEGFIIMSYLKLHVALNPHMKYCILRPLSW